MLIRTCTENVNIIFFPFPTRKNPSTMQRSKGQASKSEFLIANTIFAPWWSHLHHVCAVDYMCLILLPLNNWFMNCFRLAAISLYLISIPGWHVVVVLVFEEWHSSEIVTICLIPLSGAGALCWIDFSLSCVRRQSDGVDRLDNSVFFPSLCSRSQC